jgi:hypothetical protein
LAQEEKRADIHAVAFGAAGPEIIIAVDELHALHESDSAWTASSRYSINLPPDFAGRAALLTATFARPHPVMRALDNPRRAVSAPLSFSGRSLASPQGGC